MKIKHHLPLKFKITLLTGFLFLAQFASLTMNAQGPQIPGGSAIKTDLPVILPPSPTVASLMKFEEVPVNNYTGIPNISLPIYSFPTHSKDLTVDISLSYHPSSIAANEVASYVGLGWNLIAGGTISRTVKGLPDDIDESGANGRQGIYSANNNYYTITSLYGQQLNDVQRRDFNNFLWDAQRGVEDSEHDLYQFNFMGQSGRFYIEKGVGGAFNVTKLDNNNSVLIEYNHSSKTFEIFDDKGFKYVFDVKEVTNTGFATQIVAINNILTSTVQNGYSYNSAFHLTKIFDPNNKLLVTFTMNSIEQPMIETVHDVTTTSSRIYGTTEGSWTSMLTNYGLDQADFNRIVPMELTSSSTRSTLTKKLIKIEVEDIAKIYFENISGRSDSKLNSDAYRLNSITIKDWNDTLIRKFNLQHSYSTILDTRLMLSGITEHQTGLEKKHVLDYNVPHNLIQNDSRIGKDHWGFFNYRPDNYPATDFRDTDKNYCKVDVLQKIVYPTGGCAVFDFESNTYSYIGDQPINSFDDNPDNFTYEYIDLNFQTVGGLDEENFVIPLMIGNNGPVKVSFVPTSSIDGTTLFSSIDLPAQSGIFTLFKVIEGSPPQNLGGIGCGTVDGTCSTNEISLMPGSYMIRFGSFNSTVSLTGSIQVQIKRTVPEPKQFLYGGGIRIKKIAYYDTNFPVSSIDLIDFPDPEGNEVSPVKVRRYDYRFFGQNTRTSGALSFPKPVYTYLQTKRYHFVVNSFQGMPLPYEIGPITHIRTTSFNNLKNSRTHGADVGYQNVTVFEENNGKIAYTYTSPIDYPEADYSLIYPFYPSANIDYKRGNLIKEIIFDEIARALKITTNKYSFIDQEKNTGFPVFETLGGCRYLYRFNQFGSYYDFVVACGVSQNGGTCDWTCGPNSSFTLFNFNSEKFGWTQLEKRTIDEFFYNQGVTSTVTQSETFEYNPVNKRVSSTTTTTAENDVFKTDYFYHMTNSLHTKNRIGEIQQINSYKNSQPISSNKIVYATGIGGNTAFLPQTIQSSKGSSALETRLRYNRYDQYGNVLEVQQENGTKISYIWGYNNTQPVAKIENMAYTSIPAGLITTIQGAADESALISALNDLCGSLPGAMVTTYTYIPLIGVSTVTDPKGYRTTYEYDALGRLSSVKDHDGKYLSTNTYNYRIQN